MHENIEIKRLTHLDTDRLKQLLYLFEDVFEWPFFSIPSDKHLQRMLESSQHLVFTALLHGKIIGGLTAYVLSEFETEKSLVYIYDLAVKTEYQRQGVGQQLIQGSNAYCRQQGFVEVFVQSEEKDDFAVDFYRKTKGEEMKVIQFTYHL